MRKFLVVFALFVLPLATARAQSCPGVAPWVFVDVAASHGFCTYVTWMAQNNVTLGCRIIDANNREYCPDDNVTRLQMAAFMNRLGNALFPLTCAAGQVMKWNGAAWTCSDDSIGGSGGGGTVTSVLAGTGLSASPNPIVGAGVMNLALGYQLPQSCASGQVPKSSGTGGWACAADIDTNAGGTVTSVTAGTGLTGGTITTAGTIAVNTATIQSRVTGTCPAGSSISAIDALGNVTCETDDAGPANAFVRNGNAFGGEAVLGTTDNFTLDVRVNNSRVMRYEPNAISPNVIGGSPANNVTAGVRGASIGGGGVAGGDSDPDFAGEGPNRVTDVYGTVAGGYANRAGDAAGSALDSAFATVGGGKENTASGTQSTVGGGVINTASGPSSTVGGGSQNTAGGIRSTVAGGMLNAAGGNDSAVGGGQFNIATGNSSTVGGGSGNNASGSAATIGGGQSNVASAASSTVGGGANNTASSERGFVGGGFMNSTSGPQDNAVVGGRFNMASGTASMVAGGESNTASGNYSFAAGVRAKTQTADVTPTVHHGAFVWADNQAFDFHSAAGREFAARATGGVRFVTAIDGAGAPTRTFRVNPNAELEFGGVTRQMLNLYGTTWAIGVQSSTQYFRSGNFFGWYRDGTHSDSALDAGAGGSILMALYPAGAPPGVLPVVTGEARAQLFVSTSDRGAKEAFGEVDGQQVLSALARMPLQTWKFRNEGHEVRHIGPTAQDFRTAFGMGHDDTTIATVDADGVALAAIQGLNAKLEARLAEQAQEIADLREQFVDARAMRAELVALKAALAELSRERAAIAAR